jgi:hypothetical protein
MSNTYTRFSECFVFTKEQADLFEKFADMVVFLDKCCPEELDKDDWNEYDHKHIDLFQSLSEKDRNTFADVAELGSVPHKRKSDTEMWVYAEEHANLDGVIIIVRTVLQMTGDHESIYSMTWASYSDKLRYREFGGGYAVFSADHEDYGDSWGMAREAEKAMAAKRVQG